MEQIDSDMSPLARIIVNEMVVSGFLFTGNKFNGASHSNSCET